VAGRAHRVECDQSVVHAAAVNVGGDQVVFLNGDAWTFGQVKARHHDTGQAVDGTLVSPMPGRIVVLDVAAGEAVEKGQRLLVLEAMKLEHNLLAPFAGTVTQLRVAEGQQVVEGALLLRIDAKV